MQLSALFEKMFATLQRWLDGFVESLPNLAVALLVLVVFGYGSRYVGRLVTRVLNRITGHASLSDVFGTIARVATIVIGLAIALGLLALDKTVTSLLAGVGVVGLALGFAFQDIAANFMAGFIMAVKRPFEVGDLVEIGGQKGIIHRLELRATRLTTLQGLSVIIPNKDVFQNPIVNFTATQDRRMDMVVGVAYNVSLEQVRAVIIAAVAGVPGRDPARDTEVYYTEFGETAINIDLRFWLTSADEPTYLTARSETIIALKTAFDVNDIAMPFPIRTFELGAVDPETVRLQTRAERLASEAAAASSPKQRVSDAVATPAAEVPRDVEPDLDGQR